MPKTEIDYSNTIIYKITCRDKAVTDVYVGHTTNFVQRKHAHKQNCMNSKTPNHNCKLYEVMRANGGWDNWSMEIINFFNCADHYAARKKEQEYFIALNATLNSIEPLPKPKENITTNIVEIVKEKFFCNMCNIKCVSLYAFDIHNKTIKHKALLKSTQKKIVDEANEAKYTKFNCKLCNYNTIRHSQYTRHLGTSKHLVRTNSTKINISELKSSELFQCDKCSKTYKDRTGLWKHKKKCVVSDETLTEEPAEKEDIIHLLIKENTDFKNIILDLVKNNGDLQKQMMEVCKNTNSNNTINSHNKTFNMQVFLNEKCKDAMNIMDFVNSMTLELSDLEDVGEVGYVEGISKIIIRKLNELDIYKRPIHCSDFKREIMYVKDMDVWSKENNTFDKIRKAIKYVTKKNSDLLIPWIQKYPSGMNIEHPQNDIYMRLMNQAMGGRESFLESENKIIKKISKAVQIDKMYKC